MSDEKLTVEEFEKNCHTLIQSLANRGLVMDAVKLHDHEYIISPNSIETPYPISVKLDQNGQVSYGSALGDIIQCANCL